MDAVDVSPKTIPESPPRIRYERDFIFSFKEHVLSSETDIFDHIDLNSVAQRSSRGKLSKQLAFVKGQTDRFREPKGIVLGPQKRSWNTGCHVTQSGSRESTEISVRVGKNVSDHRSGDRYFKLPFDHRREYRNGGRDRASHRRWDNTFSGSHMDGYHRDRRQSHTEEEPEWFSGGPTTVSETIELGGIIETEKECTGFQDASMATLENSTDSKASFDSTSPNPSKLDIIIPPQRNIPREAHVSNGNQGSRFKHLFSSAEDAPTSKKESVNEQLLRLLKGTVGTNPAEPDRNNVLQVENKLRSILLGRRVPSNDEGNRNNPESRGENTKILTVEEIESQLSLPASSAQSSPSTLSIEQPSKKHTTMPTESPNIPNQQYSSENLASVLQSLTLNQPQNICSKTSTIHPSALNSLGILSNPAIRLPSSTNAMSASARINQLHQPESINPPGLNDSQGVLGRILENGPPLSAFPAQLSNTIQQMPPCTVGLGSGVNSEYDSRCRGANFSAPMLNLPGVSSTRRPIVKSQLGMPTVNGLSCEAISQKCHFMSQDIDRRFLNIVAGQQSRASGDKVSYGPMFSDSYNNACAHTPLPSHLIQASAPVVSTNNNNKNTYTHQTGRASSDANIDFLSRLVEMDRSYGSLDSRNALLPASIKPKTLEEIERQEVFNTNTYF